jgi:hypothetical protein
MRLFNPKVRTGQGSTGLTKDEFLRRRKERFYDPVFDSEPQRMASDTDALQFKERPGFQS